ncbi:MAG: PEP-CTERM sorting domain-containing protein [Thainema sp.]
MKLKLLFGTLLMAGILLAPISAEAKPSNKGGGNDKNQDKEQTSKDGGSDKNQDKEQTSTSSSVSCESGSVTFDLVGGGSTNATSCIGQFGGNDAQGDGSGALFDQLSSGVFNGITDWDFIGKSDEGGGLLNFDVDSNGTAGNWSIDSSIDGPFVISLKAGNYWSAYFFESADDVLGGSWITDGVATNKRGIPLGLSHATLFVANVEDVVKDIPEPTTAAALGLVALGATRMLKKRL